MLMAIATWEHQKKIIVTIKIGVDMQEYEKDIVWGFGGITLILFIYIVFQII